MCAVEVLQSFQELFARCAVATAKFSCASGQGEFVLFTPLHVSTAKIICTESNRHQLLDHGGDRNEEADPPDDIKCLKRCK